MNHSFKIHSVFALLIAIIGCSIAIFPEMLSGVNTSWNAPALQADLNFLNSTPDDEEKDDKKKKKQSNITFPALMVKTEENPDSSAPIQMQRLDVQVEIIGNMAVTTMDMVFFNDMDRQLEGQFYFPLNEGQTVSGFALDIENQMRKGVVIEKEKGRVVFETILRRKVDPGLLEWTKGNNFKARIFPIPAKGTRQIQISYEETLDVYQQKFRYLLPMNYHSIIDDFKLRIDVQKPTNRPGISISDPSAALNEDFKVKEYYSAQFQTKQFQASQPVQLNIPVESMYKKVYLSRFEKDSKEEKYYFMANLNPEKVSQPKSKPKEITIFWDASNSSEQRNMEAELDILDQYITTMNVREVRLFVLRNDVQFGGEYSVKSANERKILRDRMLSEPKDGATQLGAIKMDLAKGTDEILFFSDGISTIGKSNIDWGKNSIPIYTINSSISADHSALKYLAQKSGGAYINLFKMSEDQALSQLQNLNFQFLSCEPSSNISMTYPSMPTPYVHNFSLCGVLTGTRGTIKLNFGIGNKVLKSEVIDIVNNDPLDTELIRRMWAQMKLSELDMRFDANEDKILALGKEHNIVTRNTSLIVLENLDDYVQYKIVPPKHMQEAYFERIKVEKEHVETTKKNQIERVLVWFNQRKDWWNTEFNPEPLKLSFNKINIPDNYTDSLGITADSLGVFRFQSLDEGRDYLLRLEASNPHLQEDIQSVLERLETNKPSKRSNSRGEFDSLNWSDSFGDEGWGDAAPSEDDVDLEYEEEESADYFSLSTDDDGWGDSGGDDDWGASESVAAPAPERKEKESNNEASSGKKSSIQLNKWNPDMPYLRKLDSVPEKERYATYLELKKEHSSTPSFYLDVSNFFSMNGNKAMALRILSNIAELELENHSLLRILGRRLEQLGYYDLAITIFEEVLELRPEEPQSYRDLGLCYAKNGQYQEAIDHLNTVVETQWDARFDQIELIALHEINAIIARSDKKLDLKAIYPDFIYAMPQDVRVVLNWDTDNCDMDLWVTDPRGEKCYYSHKNTALGGIISRDFTGGYGPEEFCLKNAIPGKYKVQVNYFGSSTTTIAGATTIQMQLYTNFGKPNQKLEEVTLQLKQAREILDVATFSFERQ